MAPQIVQQIAEANSKGDLIDPYQLTILSGIHRIGGFPLERLCNAERLFPPWIPHDQSLKLSPTSGSPGSQVTMK